MVGVKLFLSWCHVDEADKSNLVELLTLNLKILADHDFSWWEDSHIAVGDVWRREILSGIEECDYGVMLLSPGFFASNFILTEELPHFVGSSATKLALPVMLKQIDLDGTRNLRGVEALQIFTRRGRAFADLDRHGREDFARLLATDISQRLNGQTWRSL